MRVFLLPLSDHQITITPALCDLSVCFEIWRVLAPTLQYLTVLVIMLGQIQLEQLVGVVELCKKVNKQRRCERIER